MEKFDYIIIGAGSAGSVLANRLSADPNCKVCLLEAGPPDRSVFIDTPLGLPILLRGRRYNWGFYTEPQPQLNSRRLYWPRGKTLGGSSAINAMIYMRGVPADYDDWQMPGWSWAELLPLFKDLEHNERGADDLHGAGGFLNVADIGAPNPLSVAYVQAAGQAGFPANPDFNGLVQEGSGLYQVTQKHGRRHSAARAFLDPAKSRPNLTIQTGTLVTKVILEDRHAVGVEVTRTNGAQRIMAGREVILAGGAINSPQLLLLSGIGPAAELARHNIPLAHHLPGVGQNLQDHLDITVLAQDRTRKSIGVGFGMGFTLLKAYFQYRKSGHGMLATNAAEAGSFLKLSPQAQAPEIQTHFIPAAMQDHGRRIDWGYGITLHCCQLRPKSRGFVALHSADPAAPPLIQPNYLSDDDDLNELLAGLKLARHIMAQSALAAVHGGAETAPGAKTQSDAQLVEYIRNQAETIYHPAGTCKMGTDENSVVDPTLRVHGIDNLRVADASIMPCLIGGNTNAIAMVIGEKAARMILEKE